MCNFEVISQSVSCLTALILNLVFVHFSVLNDWKGMTMNASMGNKS